MKRLSAAALLLTAAFSVLLGGGFPLLFGQEAAGETPPAAEPVPEVRARVITSEAHDEIEMMIGKPLPITVGPDGLPSGPEEFNRARDEIVNRTEPVTYDEYFEIVGKCEQKWLGPILWNLMKERQNPPISIDELKTLYERKRDSIKTFYTVFRDGDKTLTFAFKGNDQFYLEEEDRSVVNDDDATHISDYRTIRAQNKHDCRYVSFYVTKSGKKRSSAELMPRPEFSAAQFYRSENPLTMSKIACPGSRMSWDMERYLEERKNSLCLFKKPEIIDGRRCLLLADPDTKIYLDADRDYSVYAVFRHYRLKKLESRPGYISIHTSEPTSKTVLHGLKDYGGGVWLPRRAESVDYAEDGSVASKKEIVYDKIKINRGIRDRFFEDVIPDDAMVMDAFRVTDYKWRDRNLLDYPEQARAALRRQRVFRAICVSLGAVLIALAFVLKHKSGGKRAAGIVP